MLRVIRSLLLKIVESAINFWFMDEDCLWENKVHKYYFE